MRPRISIRGSVSPSVRLSVRPECVFFNEPIMGENGRKGLGKQSKCSKLVIKSSELSKNFPNCPKISQYVHFRRIVVQMDLLMSESATTDALLG